MPIAARVATIGRAMPTNPMTPLTADVSRAESDQLVTHWYAWFWFVSLMFWPRLCLVGFWIFGSFMADAFDHSWVVQVAGFIVLPWTTMTYALMWGVTTDGVFGWEWICVAIGVALDLITWGLGRSLIRGLSRS